MQVFGRFAVQPQGQSEGLHDLRRRTCVTALLEAHCQLTHLLVC
jgi:hypothetical protein